MASLAIVGVSRKPPSVTTPATPRTIDRETPKVSDASEAITWPALWKSPHTET
jgi:hypothetical protein